MRILTVAATLVFLCQAVCAQEVLGDPSIPDGERTAYRVTYGSESYTMISEVARVTVGTQEIYRISNVSPQERVTVELDRSTLATRSIRTFGNSNGLDFETVTTIAPSPGQSGRIAAVELNDLMFKLRGFLPADADVPVVFVPGTRGGQERFAPHIARVRSERLRIGTEYVDADKYEVVFSAPRLWRAFGMVPRTFLWYGIEPPHLLLRAETTEVAGSPRWLLEIIIQ